jgi:hypothetical protein
MFYTVDIQKRRRYDQSREVRIHHLSVPVWNGFNFHRHGCHEKKAGFGAGNHPDLFRDHMRLPLWDQLIARQTDREKGRQTIASAFSG